MSVDDASPLAPLVGSDPELLRAHHLALAAEARAYAEEERGYGDRAEALRWEAQALAHDAWAVEYGPRELNQPTNPRGAP